MYLLRALKVCQQFQCEVAPVAEETKPQRTLLAETMQNKEVGEDAFYTLVNLRIVVFEL